MHIYENRTANSINLIIISEDGSKITPFILTPFSKKEFTYPALDRYVPSLLCKICPNSGKLLLPNDTAPVNIVDSIVEEVPNVSDQEVAEEPEHETIIIADERLSEELLDHEIAPTIEDDLKTIEESSDQPIVAPKKQTSKKTKKGQNAN